MPEERETCTGHDSCPKGRKDATGGLLDRQEEPACGFKEQREARKGIPGVTCHRDRDLFLQRLESTIEIK